LQLGVAAPGGLPRERGCRHRGSAHHHARPQRARGVVANPPSEEPGLTMVEEDHPKFTVRGLEAWFGAKQVLFGSDIDIPRHGVTALIGPSGCGKSTFIRCLNRMHEMVPGAKMTGRVELEGENVYASRVDPVLLRRRVGMVFQKPNPF